MAKIPELKQPAGGYQFSTAWSSHHVGLWEKVLGPFRGHADLRYLEVGVHEGGSFLWMLDNILTGPRNHAVATGLFADGAERTFRSNLRLSASKARVSVIPGDSREMLQTLSRQRFDIAYIDASHTAKDTLRDALAVWDLLEIGGVLLFDDYGFGTPLDSTFLRTIPEQLCPRPAIDAFVTAHRDELRVLHRGWQVILQRIENRCFSFPFDPRSSFDPKLCTPLGPLVYNWQTGAFHGPNAPPLDSDERALLEGYLTSFEPGRVDLPSAARPQGLDALFRRLGIGVESREPEVRGQRSVALPATPPPR